MYWDSRVSMSVVICDSSMCVCIMCVCDEMRDEPSVAC